MQLTVFLILAHILTDYFFQNEYIAKKKEDSWLILLLHSGTFGILALLLILPAVCWQIVISVAGLTIFHFILDKAKILCCKKFLKKGKNWRFELEIADQALHIGAIVAISGFINLQALSLIPLSFAEYYLSRETTMATLYIAAFVFIGKGGTVLVRGILEKTGYTPNKNSSNLAALVNRFSGKANDNNVSSTGQNQETYRDNNDPPKPTPSDYELTEKEYNVGRLIGTLERIIILGLALIGEYTAIGFVLAAKSIGRFKALEENREFAEYYIVGTLSSAIIALAVAFVVKEIGKLI